MVSSLVQRCLSICSRCSDIFFEKKKKNTHPSSFMANCFTCLLNKLYCATHQLNTVEKKLLMLVLQFLGILLLQTTTKFCEALKRNVRGNCKMSLDPKTVHLTSFYLERFINTSVEDVTSLNTVR